MHWKRKEKCAMNRYLVDTNIVIKALNGDAACRNIIAGNKIYISVVTEIERYSWNKLTEDDIAAIDAFLKQCFIYTFYTALKPIIIELRKRFGLKLPDAIIIATAIDNGLTVVSSESRFAKVQDLSFIHVT